jgi:hypothetical protein
VKVTLKIKELQKIMFFKTKTQMLALLIVLLSNGINYTFLKPLEDIRFHVLFNSKLMDCLRLMTQIGKHSVQNSRNFMASTNYLISRSK